MGAIFLFWLSSQGQEIDKLVCTFQDYQALEKAQSASLSATERAELLSASKGIGTDISVSFTLLTTFVCLLVKFTGKPDAGNLHVRFDEGEGLFPPYSTMGRG